MNFLCTPFALFQHADDQHLVSLWSRSAGGCLKQLSGRAYPADTAAGATADSIRGEEAKP